MMQRKLLPTPPNEQNISCPDVCVDSTSCTYGCDGYEDFFPIPPASLQPAPASSRGGGQPVSTLLIIVITVLAFSFLLVGYYVIIVKCFTRWNPFRVPRRQSGTTMNEEFLDENRGPEIDHPIWYINTIGLQPSIINAIAVFRYKRGDNLIEGTECAVCLTEFRNDETLRLLPKCNHAFHVPCIDTWLRAHTNCPVCRAGIVSNAMARHPLASNGVNSIIIPMDESSDDGENSVTGESNENDEVTDDLLCENRLPDISYVTQFHGVDCDNQDAMDTCGKAYADSKGNNEDVIEHRKDEIQSVRRTVSVDSFMAADISEALNGLSMVECEGLLVDPNHKIEPKQGSGEDGSGNSGGQRTNDGSSITDFLRKKPVRMKRSFSYAGRSLLLRHQHPRSNSILPL